MQDLSVFCGQNIPIMNTILPHSEPQQLLNDPKSLCVHEYIGFYGTEFRSFGKKMSKAPKLKFRSR